MLIKIHLKSALKLKNILMKNFRQSKNFRQILILFSDKFLKYF